MRQLVLPLTAALLLATAAGSSAAPRWSDGKLATEIQNVNCPSLIFGSPYAETEVGAYVGQYVDDGSPVVGEVFDVHLVVAVLGNECAGTRPKLEIALPPGVRPAVGGAHAIRCWLRADSSQPFGAVTAAEGCPTALGPGTTNHPAIAGWLSLDPAAGTPAAPAWPLPQGAQLEIQVPVVADRVLNGIGDPSGCVCAVASIQTVNGISRPDDAFTWASGSSSTGAYVHLFAFPGPGGGAANPGPPGPGGSGTGGSPFGPFGPPGPSGAAGVVPAAPAAAPALRLARRVSRAALRRGKLRARLSGLQRGDRIRLRLRRGRTTIAQGTATATSANATVRVRAGRGRSARRALRRIGRLSVVVTVTRSGARVRTLRSSVRLT